LNVCLQIPNFLIASPTLIMSLWGALAYAAANPHHLLTGGLLTQQQLQRWFAGSSSSSSSSLGRSCCDEQQKSLQQAECSHQQCSCSSSRRCAILVPVIVGYWQYVCGSSGSARDGGAFDGAAAAGDASLLPVKEVPKIPGVAYQPLRQRQLEVSATKQQIDGQLLPQQQQRQQQPVQARMQGKQLRRGQQMTAVGTAAEAACTASMLADEQQPSCSCSLGRAFYSPGIAVFVVHWLLLTLVCLAVVHIQVATRLLSSCVPLYWFAALLMLHKGGLLRWLLWWYCFAFMGVGFVFFTNFFPWT
jgi:hypothetical protein